MRVWTVCLLYWAALSAAARDVTPLEGDLADSMFGELEVCRLSAGSDRIGSDARRVRIIQPMRVRMCARARALCLESDDNNRFLQDSETSRGHPLSYSDVKTKTSPTLRLKISSHLFTIRPLKLLRAPLPPLSPPSSLKHAFQVSCILLPSPTPVKPFHWVS